MPAPFKQLNREQFAALVDKFPFTRKITAVHMHHTWKPTHAQYKGHETIVGMWQFHTATKGWQDIAQHITIAPDGSIWLGRNWNLPPVSAKRHNGTATAGPFMFEIIGNFDRGNDPFEGEQRATTLEVIARIQRKFQLPPQSLFFHNALSTKTCPGNSIDQSEIISEVTSLHASLASTRVTSRTSREGPFGADALEITQVVEASLEALGRSVPQEMDSADAELCHDESESGDVLELNREGTRDTGLGPATLEALRPHLVNLNMGQFSSEGEWKTTREDVDAIFEEHLPQALAKAPQKPLRIVFFAHGGLVKESAGLKLAKKHIDWWVKNGVYPIYFIWETGLLETIGQLIRRTREGAARALARDIFDHTTDPLIEVAARALQGPRVWGGMKMSAQLASARGLGAEGGEGGARYVAKKLSVFCADKPNNVELHAFGHSAGSIFHSYFLPAALDEGTPGFKSVHFLAPAVRVDTFKTELASRIGNGVDHLCIFTMSKRFEQDDNCLLAYRKSLLYFIYHALEAERKTPILGLEESLRADAELKTLFGLGVTSTRGEAIWSESFSKEGRSASRATTHGDFDDDAATMGSVARRILGKADADKIVEYVPDDTGARGVDRWNDQVDWPEHLQSEVGFILEATTSAPMRPLYQTAPIPPKSLSAAGGRRRALCVGINHYPTAPLNGCVADVKAWASMFRSLGFEEPILLLDARATRAAIIESLTSLVTSSRPGDVIVFQYSGHGTTVPDVSGDEQGGDTSDTDEAICPYDFAEGRLLIDDDIGAIFNGLPSGVNLTCFMDCCHSGTISRFAVGKTPGADITRSDARARFIVASDELKQAHRRFHASFGSRRAVSSGGPSLMKEVVFSACLSSEVAWESSGHGEFTVRALGVLQTVGIEMTNAQFEQRVTAEFGPAPRQHARLYCAPAASTARFMQPWEGVVDDSDRRLAPPEGARSLNAIAAAAPSYTGARMYALNQ